MNSSAATATMNAAKKNRAAADVPDRAGALTVSFMRPSPSRFADFAKPATRRHEATELRVLSGKDLQNPGQIVQPICAMRLCERARRDTDPNSARHGWHLLQFLNKKKL